MTIRKIFKNFSRPQIPLYLPEHNNKKIEVVVDTGFTGELALTNELIRELGLKDPVQRTITTANGREETVDQYFLKISWFDADEVEVLGVNGKANLLGMRLLKHRLTTVDMTGNDHEIIIV